MAGSPEVPARCRVQVQATRVAVVGAGFAGLLAARTLARAGMKVSVFEARKEVGGRVRSDVTFSNGRITEVGAELVGSIHTRWCALAIEYGISLISRMNDDLYAGQQLNVPLVLDKLLNRSEIVALETAKRAVLLRLARAAAHIVDPAQPWTQPKLQPFDGLSVAQALVALGVTPGSRLWLGLRHLLENDNVAPLEELNLLGLLCLLKGGQTGTIATDRVGRLMGYWDELEIYRCGDGCQTLARKVSTEVSKRPHCQVVTSRAVTAIAIKAAGVEVTSQLVDGATRRGAPTREDFDYVVLAVPPGVWHQIAISPQRPEQAIGVMRSGPAVKLFTEVGRRFWVQDRQAPSGGSLALGQVWEGTDNQTRIPPRLGGPRPQGIVLSAFAGGRKVTQAGMTAELAKLYRNFPASPRQLFADWPNADFIKTGFCSPGRNQIFGIGPQLNRAFHARLFFAGEHTQLDHFGYMEGAIRSGERAAGQIIDAVCRLGRQPASPIRVASRDQDPEEIIEPDELVLVRNAAGVPNRWICAIDVYDDHPAWGGGGPRHRLRGRGTGVLIGPRYLLTAAHVVDRAASLGISPGRGGSNGTHPLGRAGVKAVHRAAPFRVRRDVRQGGRTLRDVPFEIREDYALVILDQDLGAATTPGPTRGPLSFWGAAGSGTRIRALPPAELTGREVTVSGYPGDRCGSDRITGSAVEKERKINTCVAQRPDEWASTQWAGRGVATATADNTVLAHTVDTYSGQSGSPICLRSTDALDLVGVHTGPGTTANLGIRITDRMLTELCGWINTDAGAQLATVVDHVLRVAARAPAVKVPA